MNILEINNLTMRFGGLTAVDNVSFSVESGSLSGLIGPNGAGKTTLFNMVTGVYEPTEGSIRFQEAEISGSRPYQVANAGIARTFQNIRLFPTLSVFDNVRTGFNNSSATGFFGSIFRLGGYARNERIIAGKIDALLDKFGLLEMRSELARNLSYGDRRRVEIVRAMATGPQLLLLDEPAAGMNPTEKRELMELIRYLRDEFGIAILLIEHDMKVVMGICENIAVLDHGAKIAEGTPESIRNNNDVITAYLGAPTT